MQKAVGRQWVNHILGSVASAKAYKSTRVELMDLRRIVQGAPAMLSGMAEAIVEKLKDIHPMAAQTQQNVGLKPPATHLAGEEAWRLARMLFQLRLEQLGIRGGGTVFTAFNLMEEGRIRTAVVSSISMTNTTLMLAPPDGVAFTATMNDLGQRVFGIEGDAILHCRQWLEQRRAEVTKELLMLNSMEF